MQYVTNAHRPHTAVDKPGVGYPATDRGEHAAPGQTELRVRSEAYSRPDAARLLPAIPRIRRLPAALSQFQANDVDADRRS